MKLPGLLGALLLVPSVAVASPLADALKRAKPADVEALRANRTDPATRCTLGAVYAKRKDLSRGALYLAGCDDAELPDDIGTEIRKLARDTKKQLAAGDLAQIEIASSPDGITTTTDALPGEAIVAPATIYVPPGEYVVRGTHEGTVFEVRVNAPLHGRAVAYLDTKTKKQPPPVKDQQVDFSEEGGVTETSGPPPAVKRPSLVPDRYTGKLGPSGPTIDDPLAAGRSSSGSHAVPWQIGARLAGGMFDDAAASARAGLAIAAVGRYEVGRAFLAGRLDWSQRGGGDAVDVLGLSVGGGLALFGPVSALAQLRGDLRLDSDRMANRGGASVAAGIEAVLPSTPIVAGLRFEQGLTTFADDARDRALLLEVGVDWPW